MLKDQDENEDDKEDTNDQGEEKEGGGEHIENSEEMAKSRIGEKLYEKLIKDYTYKQWNKYPKELDKSVLERIPVKNNYDTRYFTDKYQVLPDKGYTNFIKQLLNNKLITIILNTDYNEYKKNNDLSIFKKIIYTGSIDKYFDKQSNTYNISVQFKMSLQSLIDKKGSLGGGDITEELYKLTDSLESLYNQKSKLL